MALFSFNNYKKHLGTMNDQELLALSNLCDDMCHAVLHACEAGGPAHAQDVYERQNARNMEEIRDFILKRHEMVERRLP